MEATRCQPSASATSVTAMSSHSAGETTNHAVSPTNATRAPRLSRFLPGSTSGVELIRPDSLPKATTEPVKVTAPMKTPMNTSPRWMPRVPTASSAAAATPSGCASTSR